MKHSDKQSIYRHDLAYIHVDGYGFHWEGASPAILDWLNEFGTAGGRVIDLGCGGGQWLRVLASHDYKPTGVDVSNEMIQIAKQNAPEADYICGCFSEADLPPCDAVTSLGEPLNYLNSGPKMRRTMRNVFKALRPGGVFIFDVRHPARGVSGRDHQAMAEDWFCYARIEDNGPQNSITRQITTFRKVSDGNYRRDFELHRLKVFTRKEVSGWLRKIGFRVRVRSSYGDYQLGPRQSVFICRKPVKRRATPKART